MPGIEPPTFWLVAVARLLQVSLFQFPSSHCVSAHSTSPQNTQSEQQRLLNKDAPIRLSRPQVQYLGFGFRSLRETNRLHSSVRRRRAPAETPQLLSACL